MSIKAGNFYVAILTAPPEFNGSLEEFYEKYAQHVLIPAPVVEEFHHQLVAYLHSADPIYLIRQVKTQIRGETLQINNGARMRLTDNSPAWWLHYQLFTGKYKDFSSFQELIDAVPSHMFDIKIKGHISQSGWHVAHLYEVKDRDTDFYNWEQSELIKRTARSIHPCNYFYIAKYEKSWIKYGQDENYLSFFYEKFKMKYQTIWNDFLRLIDANPLSTRENAGGAPYIYPISGGNKKEQKHSGKIQKQNTLQMEVKISGCKVEYEFSRLCFKADLIEPLDWDDYFCVITKGVVFKMTKREFYENFPNVVGSKSYQERRIYHYPTIPKKAEKFIFRSLQ